MPNQGVDALATPTPSSNATAAPNADISAQNGTSGENAANPASQRSARPSRTPLKNLGTWFMGAVVFALLPPVAQLFQEMSLKHHETPGFFEFCARADLYIVSMGLAASAIAQAHMRAQNVPSFWNFLNIIVLFFATFLGAGADDKNIDPEVLGRNSFLLLIATLISAGTTTYLSEREPTDSGERESQ
ncbi:hypothetical protein AB0B12_35400 [Streptomyces sp. NPDC044780]|uniref:hypothetical protein n=1 Tax=unclassified Streptomyces TaxID=2593676 RepID=UPI0033EADE78